MKKQEIEVVKYKKLGYRISLKVSGKIQHIAGFTPEECLNKMIERLSLKEAVKLNVRCECR
jgi:hypothetical protein